MPRNGVSPCEPLDLRGETALGPGQIRSARCPALRVLDQRGVDVRLRLVRKFDLVDEEEARAHIANPRPVRLGTARRTPPPPTRAPAPSIGSRFPQVRLPG